jgi:hypothetical protein
MFFSRNKEISTPQRILADELRCHRVLGLKLLCPTQDARAPGLFGADSLLEKRKRKLSANATKSGESRTVKRMSIAIRFDFAIVLFPVFGTRRYSGMCWLTID